VTIQRHPSRRRQAVLVFALIGAAGLLSTPLAVPARVANAGVAIGDSPAGAAAALGGAPATGAAPTIHYEEWLTHADDPNRFTPGDRVAVPFRPAALDGQLVDGHAPRALPDGRASGRAMAATKQGVRWADVPGSPPPDGSGPASAPPDQPLVDPSAVIKADGAAATVPVSSAAPFAPTAAFGLRREVFGFLPYWELSDSTTTLDYDVLSTIAYFGVGSDKYGNLLKQDSAGAVTTGWGGWTSSKLTDIIQAAHGKGTRVVLTVQMFAWSTSQAAAQGAFLASPSARLNLAKQAAAAVRDRGADGVNLDFEPIATGYADEFAAFVRTMRAELDAIAPGYQLTFDTTGWIGNYPIEAATAPGGADAIFIMGYDYRGSSSSPVGSIAPLGGPLYDIGDTLDAYLARVPASKLILGVPYYGRAWSTVSDAQNASNQSGLKNGYSATATYGTAMDLIGQYGRRYDPVEQVAWTAYRRETCTTQYGCVTSWRQLYFDDVQALSAKYDLVNRRDLRGVGLWALGYDGTRTELYGALRSKFIDATASVVVTRLAGADRYATAAAVSAATFAAGAPVAYIATGLNFPDALAGAVAAARAGGPLLLVRPDGVPPATAAELKRLKPTRIVILGATGVVPDATAAAARAAALGP
jgi:spore germination protein YaaH